MECTIKDKKQIVVSAAAAVIANRHPTGDLQKQQESMEVIIIRILIIVIIERVTRRMWRRIQRHRIEAMRIWGIELVWWELAWFNKVENKKRIFQRNKTTNPMDKNNRTQYRWVLASCNSGTSLPSAPWVRLLSQILIRSNLPTVSKLRVEMHLLYQYQYQYLHQPIVHPGIAQEGKEWHGQWGRLTKTQLYRIVLYYTIYPLVNIITSIIQRVMK